MTHGSAWIGLAVLSGILTSARHLFIKKTCWNVPPDLLVFSTRAIGAAVYTALLIVSRPVVAEPFRFSAILCATVVITAVATVHQMRMIQREPLTETIPFFALIPVMMIPWTMILQRQIPAAAAGLGIILSCAGIYGLYVNPDDTLFQPVRRMLRSTSARSLFLISLALAFTTVCDRIAIAFSSALTYAALWTVFSAIVMGAFLSVRILQFGPSILLKWPMLLQGGLWTGAFFCQMLAVQYALNLNSGVTYVKMLTLFHVLFSVIIGGALFREAHLGRRIASVVFMMAGAFLVIAFR